MIKSRDVENAADLALIIERLSRERDRLRESGPLSFPDVQRMAHSLTRVQLVLNDLERVALRQRGISRDLVERFAALECSIRAMRDDLYTDLGRRTASLLEGAGAAGGPGHEGGNDDAYDPVG